ncbi:MAG: hypothetical protein ACOCUI_03685 [bacterium]
MSINIYEMWGTENFEGFYNAFIAIHLGCLAFIAPKLLEVTNQLQNISGLLVKYFNHKYKLKYSLFGIYVSVISFSLVITIASILLKDIQASLIIPNFILVIVSIYLSSRLLLRMNSFHNQIINLAKKYNYKTPEKENNLYPIPLTNNNNIERKTPNIKWNNEILDLWEEIIVSKINQNGNISQISEMIDEGILSFWGKYCTDVENQKIEFQNHCGFAYNLNGHIFYPLKKITYLNQVACINKNDELSFSLINKLIYALSITPQEEMKAPVENIFEQAIQYKINHLYFGDYFDTYNISSFINYICQQIEEEFNNNENGENKSNDELGIIPFLDCLDSIVNISKAMISNYKNILIDKRWQKIFEDRVHRHKECTMIIQHTNLKILTNFLLLDEYKLVYDYMNYYKNYERNFKMGWTSTQYLILPLNINFWNYLLDNKWSYKDDSGNTKYSIKAEFLELFFLCRLKYHIDEQIMQKMHPKHESKSQGKLKLKLSSETVNKVFNDEKLLSPWKLSEEEKEHYKKRILDDIESF